MIKVNINMKSKEENKRKKYGGGDRGRIEPLPV